MARVRLSKKTRRHGGWIYPDSTIKAPQQEIIDNCLEPQPYWDNWFERRDGQRNMYSDHKKILKMSKHQLLHDDCLWCKKKLQMNIKQKKLLKRRKAMKHRKT